MRSKLALAFVVVALPALAQPRDVIRVSLPADLQGTLDGVEYRIRVPANWNRTLLVYAHGTQDGPPAVELAPVAEPPVTPSLEDRLLAQGFALAGAGYPNNDKIGIQSTLNLTKYFKHEISNPDRIIVWGSSLGGLLTAKLLEDHPGVFDGGIANCGPLAGDAMDNDWSLAFGLAYSAGYGWPDSLWGPLPDLRDGLDFWTEVAPYVNWPATDPDYGKWEFIRRILQLPWEAFWGVDPQTGNVLFGMGMWKATAMRSRLEQEAGGPVAQNRGVVYSLTPQDKIDLAALGVDADASLAYMNARTNVEASPHALRYLREWGIPDGRLERPLLTMHAIFDGLAVVANEGVYASRVAEARSSHHLVQAYVNTVGHCSFTIDQYLSTVAAMNSWLDTRHRPDATLLPPSLGFNLGFVSPPWPFKLGHRDDRDDHHDCH